MNLGPDKLTACKLNTIELREIRRTTLSKNKHEQGERVNQNEHALETQDMFPKFGQPQRLHTSPLKSSQRAGSLSTLILSE
jgi:hypothetical protein